MAAVAISVSQSIFLEGLCCASTSNSWIKAPIDGRRVPDLSNIGHTFAGGTHFHGLATGKILCPTKVSVAADYSDSVPDSSNYKGKQGYHPLEELKGGRRMRNTKLTSAEIARTTVEANSSALLVFPGAVHNEPHEQVSWSEFQYVVDDYGDIFFEIFDSENILEDPGANNPVNALFGIDIQTYEEKRMASEDYIASGIPDDVPLYDSYYDVYDEDSDIFVDWGMPDNSKWVHPVYFAKCLTKAINMEFRRAMDHPSNGVSIVGSLRPAFFDEEPYLRRLFHSEESDGYNSDWKDDDTVRDNSKADGVDTGSTLYRLEIVRIELFSVYGVQYAISLQDFQDAEPDVLVHYTPEILERFSENGIGSNAALKALCKKKGLHVERANLIGVDSLGMDVRVSSGAEVQTHRFPFKSRATSEVTAEKQIQQLLFPKSQRKKLRTKVDKLADSF